MGRESKKEAGNDIEDKIERAGGCGLFHAWLIMMTSVPLLLVGANMAAMIYEGLIPTHYCKLPYINQLEKACNMSWSYDLYNKAVPLENAELSTCRRYEVTNFTNNLCTSWFVTDGSNYELKNETINRKTLKCDEWIYDRSVMFNTIVSEFDLVCKSEWTRYISQSAFMFGVLLGSIFTGVISDRFGRRNAFLMSSIGALVFGTAAAFAQSSLTFTVLRGISGFFVYCNFPTLYVLLSEFTLAKYRATVQQFSESFFTFGLMMLSLLAFLTRDWRTLQLALSVPALLSFPIWWFLPESPRWLQHNHEEKKLSQVMKQMSQINGIVDLTCEKDYPKEERENNTGVELVDNVEESTSLDRLSTSTTNNQKNVTSFKFVALAMLKYPGLRLVSLVNFYQWFAVSCVYYGLTLNAAELGGDPFINLLLSSFVEVISNFITIPLVNYMGRRTTCTIAEVCAGLLCIAIPYIPSNITWLYVGTSIMGRFFIAISFNAAYIHLSELYPTSIRSVACGVNNAWARFGGIVSPLIAMLSLVVSNLSYTVFGIVSLLSGFLVLLLPETVNQKMTTTIEEGEAFILEHPGLLIGLFVKKRSTKKFCF